MSPAGLVRIRYTIPVNPKTLHTLAPLPLVLSPQATRLGESLSKDEECHRP